MTACDIQEQPGTSHTPISNITEVNTTPEKPAEKKAATEKPRPALILSIENISVDDQKNDDNFFDKDYDPTEATNTLFEKQSKNQLKHNLNLRGKLLTDDDKLENKEYLDSVEGVQINIEGNFN